MKHEEEVEQQQSREASPEERPSLPLAQSLSCGVSTFLAAGIVDLVAHLGPTGLVVGGIAAYVASQHGPELLEQVKGAMPTTRLSSNALVNTPRRLASESSKGKRSVLDRALGRFPAHEDADTVLVDEPEETPTGIEQVVSPVSSPSDCAASHLPCA